MPNALASTQFSYDPLSNLLKLTDANGGATQHSYDAKNRLLTRTDPLLKNETYQYDGNDNAVKVTNRKIRKAQRSNFKHGAKILTISGAAEGYLRSQPHAETIQCGVLSISKVEVCNDEDSIFNVDALPQGMVGVGYVP